jgi:hypothetical protein
MAPSDLVRLWSSTFGVLGSGRGLPKGTSEPLSFMLYNSRVVNWSPICPIRGSAECKPIKMVSDGQKRGSGRGVEKLVCSSSDYAIWLWNRLLIQYIVQVV